MGWAGTWGGGEPAHEVSKAARRVCVFVVYCVSGQGCVHGAGRTGDRPLKFPMEEPTSNVRAAKTHLFKARHPKTSRKRDNPVEGFQQYKIHWYASSKLAQSYATLHMVILRLLIRSVLSTGSIFRVGQPRVSYLPIYAGRPRNHVRGLDRLPFLRRKPAILVIALLHASQGILDA